MPKPCPSLARQTPEGPWLVAGRTQMMLGVRVMKTWNPTTKEFEIMVRPGISQGTNGEKVFRFRPDQLI